MPALREADPGALVLADGLSCRTQIRELSDRKPMHIAQVIAGAKASRENARALRRSATSNS
jgi:Fe-S oxidoreductase